MVKIERASEPTVPSGPDSECANTVASKAVCKSLSVFVRLALLLLTSRQLWFSGLDQFAEPPPIAKNLSTDQLQKIVESGCEPGVKIITFSVSHSSSSRTLYLSRNGGIRRCTWRECAWRFALERHFYHARKCLLSKTTKKKNIFAQYYVKDVT